MRPGDLVLFTAKLYQGWGMGLVLSTHEFVDYKGRRHGGFYDVLTHAGVKVVSNAFMEKVQGNAKSSTPEV